MKRTEQVEQTERIERVKRCEMEVSAVLKEAQSSESISFKLAA